MRKALFASALVFHILLISTLAPAMRDLHRQKEKQSFRIEGKVENEGEWTAERLSREFAGDVKTVSYTLKGEKGVARCVPLLSLVQAAKLRLNSKVKNHQLAFVVTIRAEDGYTVAFSMGELLPNYGKREVWLALDRDGKPLSDKDGPVEVLVPADEKPSRWVHSVARITVVDGFQRETEKRK